MEIQEISICLENDIYRLEIDIINGVKNYLPSGGVLTALDQNCSFWRINQLFLCI